MAFARAEGAEGTGRLKTTLKEKKYASTFVRAYLIKKLQFNNIVMLKNRVTHGSLIISMDKLKYSRNVTLATPACRWLSISHPQRVQSCRSHRQAW